MKNVFKFYTIVFFAYFCFTGLLFAKCITSQNERTLNDYGYNFTQKNEWQKAYDCFLISFDKYDSDYASGWLGYIYVNGTGSTSIDYDLGFKYFSHAANNGNAYSMGQLGIMYKFGNGTAKNFSKSFEWFSKGAKKGDTLAQEQLGQAYNYGKGVEQDYEKGFYWNKKAADKGDKYAQGNLGWMYASGYWVDLDFKEAVKYFSLCAERNDPHPYCIGQLGISYVRGEGIEKDFDKGLSLLYEAAEEHGDKYALAELGWLHGTGEGVEKNSVEAIRLYKLSSEKGNSYATAMLGYHYLKGEGVPDDEKTKIEGIKFSKIAAEQNETRAFGDLGWAYASGLGVEQDDKVAVEWLKKGAKAGDSYSQERLGWHFANGVGITKNNTKAVEYYELAAENGDVYAQESLAYHYENGLGVTKDLIKALKWFELAKGQDSSYAEDHIAAILKDSPHLAEQVEENISNEKVSEEKIIAKDTIPKPIDNEKISKLLDKDERKGKKFTLDKSIKLEWIDRMGKVVFESFVRLEPNAISDRVKTVNTGDSIYIAAKIMNETYYLVNDLNGIQIGYIQENNVDLGGEKPPEKIPFDFGSYYALLIGNNDYHNEGFLDLETPINDVKAIEDILKNKYGFIVETLTDASENQIQDAIADYSNDDDGGKYYLNEDDNLLIYYAGHGDDYEVSGVGYWQGVDAIKGRRSTWVANSDITNEIKGLKAKHIIVIADSCYSGTIIVERGSEDKITRQQKNKEAFVRKKHKKTARVAITSGDIGERVVDKEKLNSKHSPFAETFIAILKDNNDLLYSNELHALIESHMMSKDLDQLPLWGKIIGTGHIDGGDFPFQSIE